MDGCNAAPRQFLLPAGGERTRATGSNAHRVAGGWGEVAGWRSNGYDAMISLCNNAKWLRSDAMSRDLNSVNRFV